MAQTTTIDDDTEASSTSTSPPVKLHELTPPRVTIKCHTQCGMMTRVYSIEPSTQIGAYRYCPQCGSQNISAFMSAETNHWEALARDYNLPIAVMQQLYKLWIPSTHYRFADFVHELRDEIAAGKLDAIAQERKNTAKAVQRVHATPLLPLPKLRIPGKKPT